ncbi:hypothetical protein D3C83_185090 [compost metagenome]
MLWPKGWGGGFDWPSAVIGAVAFVAMFRYQAGIMTVVGASAAAGLAITLAKAAL